MQLAIPTIEPPSGNPARARGLRRARRTRAPCGPVASTPMPEDVGLLAVLVFHCRMRQARIDSGAIRTPSRLYDIRTYKDVLAEYAYLRRLAAAGRTGGTILTSMPQLVAGLAALHPRWTMTGDKFVDRDRHHQAVKARLRDMQDMGLLRWRVGVDVDGEDARTEIELLPAPSVTDTELDAARTQLKRWEKRYGRELNTGSSTGIRGARRHARPLTASERERRGVASARAKARSRREASLPNSDPHFVASATPKNSPSPSRAENFNACGLRTGARVSSGVPPSSRSDATTVKSSANQAPASKPPGTASLTTRRANAADTAGPAIDLASVLERLAARVAARQPVLDVIASQAGQRALEVALWTADRGLPPRRLQEAWVVWRRGATHLAEHGPGAAGPLEDGDLQVLARAAGRYEHYSQARDPGFPAGGLAALAMIGQVAAAHDMRPETLHYAIRRLDQMSKRMRASATVGDRRRLKGQVKRARRRRDRLAIVTPQMQQTGTTWLAARWPFWAALDAHGEPIVIDGELQLDSIYGSYAPKPSDPEYVLTLRDAQLLTGWEPIDGRALMASSDASHNGLHARQARPGPYPPPAGRGPRDPADVELARLADITLQDAKRLPVAERDRVLEQLHAGATHRDARDRAEWFERFTKATNTDHHA